MGMQKNSIIDIFPWNESFNIGITEIDQQHQKLVELINKLAWVMVGEDDVQITMIHNELDEYAQLHFNDEEVIWKTYLNDDDLFKKHESTHESFMSKVIEISANQEGKPYHKTVEAVVKFLIHWLTFHILDTDNRMAIIIKELENGSTLAQAKTFCDEKMSASQELLINNVLGMYDNLSARTIDLMRERHLRTLAEIALRNINDSLEQKIIERTKNLKTVQEVTMVAMGALAEIRDLETGYHIRRTQHYVKILAEKLSSHPKYSHFLTSDVIDTLYLSSPLHDIGKIGIPDKILHKQGKLTDAEFDIMKQHSTFGRDAILIAESVMDKKTSFLTIAKEIAYSHHEKWDGSGYPEGLVGVETPISARIMAVADVYDALITKRVYKKPFSHEKAVKIIIEGKGIHFDPDIVDVFITVADDFYKVFHKSNQHKSSLV